MPILGIVSSGVIDQTAGFESIASASGTGSSGTITFSSIPSTYKHLQIRFVSRDTTTGTTNEDLFITFNGVGGSNYARTYFNSNGSGVNTGSASTQSEMYLLQASPKSGTVSNTFGTGIITITDYANTSKYTTMHALVGSDLNGSGNVGFFGGTFTSTAAIESITITSNGANFATGSSFALYGIKG